MQSSGRALAPRTEQSSGLWWSFIMARAAAAGQQRERPAALWQRASMVSILSGIPGCFRRMQSLPLMFSSAKPASRPDSDKPCP